MSSQYFYTKYSSFQCNDRLPSESLSRITLPLPFVTIDSIGVALRRLTSPFALAHAAAIVIDAMESFIVAILWCYQTFEGVLTYALSGCKRSKRLDGEACGAGCGVSRGEGRGVVVVVVVVVCEICRL